MLHDPNREQVHMWSSVGPPDIRVQGQNFNGQGNPISRKDAKAQRKACSGFPLRLGAFARSNSR